MASDTNYYYVVVGTQLFYKTKGSNNDWQRIPTPTFASGIGGTGGTIKVATYNGVYNLSGLAIGAQVDPAQRAKILSDGTIVKQKAGSVGIVQIGNEDFSGDVVGKTGSGYVDQAGKNTNVTGATVSGADGDFVSTTGHVGRNSAWADSKISFGGIKTVTSGASLGLSSDVLALIGTSGGGYFELYTKDSKLSVRSPKSTVAESITYEVSDLAKAVVLGFFKGDDGEFFVLTGNRGLWSNRDGQWRWE